MEGSERVSIPDYSGISGLFLGFHCSTILSNIAGGGQTLLNQQICVNMHKALWVSLLILLLSNETGLTQEVADNRLMYRNLALESYVTVSSVGEKGLNGEQAVDGDTLSRWSSEYNDNEWIQLDLGKEYRSIRWSLNGRWLMQVNIHCNHLLTG